MVILNSTPLPTYLVPKRPMLAATLTEEYFDKLFKKFPVLFGLPKIDGVRGLCFSTQSGYPQLFSRRLKPLPNRHLQRTFANMSLLGCDGEFITGLIIHQAKYHVNQSAVMTQGGEPDFSWLLFDYLRVGPFMPYWRRLEALQKAELDNGSSGLVYRLPWVEIHSTAELVDYEQKQITAGFEGVILRDPMAAYKHDRSTLIEGGMLKLKRFEDSEAVILDVIQLETNCNEARYDERGFTQRSSRADGKILANKMGSIAVKDITSGVEFSIGSGFNELQRREIWRDQLKYIGKLVKYKYQPHGMKEKPRNPVFLGFRHLDDL